MEKEVTAGPVRVRLVFADRNLLNKAQKSEGLRRCWVVIDPDPKTVAELCGDIAARFGLSYNSSHGILLSMDGFVIPPCESTSIFRDNDKIRVKGFIPKKGKKAVSPPSNRPQVKLMELANRETIVSSNGISIIDNGDDATEIKRKKRKRPLLKEISSQTAQEEREIATCSKDKKLKLVATERPAATNERRTNIPAVAAPSEFHTVNEQSNTPIIVSQRIEQAVSISKCAPTTRFYGGPKEKNVLGACCKNGNQHSLSGYWIPGQARFMSPDAGPSKWQDNGPRGDDGSRARKTWKPRNGYNGPTARNRATHPWKNSSGLNAINAPLKMGNDFTTGDAAEKIHPREEDKIKDKLDFESLDPVPRLPMEGDIIAYRLDIIDSLGCPGLSSFRVGKVIVFDPVLMIIFLLSLPEYPTPDCEISEFEKDMYKEDGSLEIDFESLVDLRLVKESQLKAAPMVHKSGKGKGKSKSPSCQDNAGSSVSILAGNDNSVESAWEVGEASNAKAAVESDWGAWVPSTRCGASGPSVGQYASGSGLRVDYSRVWNTDGRNSNFNSPWETNVEATNANEGTQAQQNGWDAWEPSTSYAGASRRCIGQHHNGFRSGDGYSIRGGRRGRGGKYLNRKLNK